MDYSEKLKDPRWQKRRLEILERDKWKCIFCGDKESTLHVHHIEYRSGLNPWEYDDLEMITLCDSCHKLAHSKHPDVKRLVLIVIWAWIQLQHEKEMWEKKEKWVLAAIMRSNGINELSYTFEDFHFESVDRTCFSEREEVLYRLVPSEESVKKAS